MRGRHGGRRHPRQRVTRLGFLIQGPSLHQREEVDGSRRNRGSPYRAPPFLFSQSNLPDFRPFPADWIATLPKCAASFLISRGSGETGHRPRQQGRSWPLVEEFPRERTVGRVLFCAVFFLPIANAGVECLATDPGEWRLLSRVQVNPPGVQAFVETFYSYNQLKAGFQVETWCLGLPRFHRIEQDTDVFVSRFLRSEDRWTPPVPIAESKDLERSPEIWIDDQSGAVHAAWVGNERRKPGGPRSELRIGHRRSEDGGTTWTPPRHFAVGTALARRPQLMGRRPGRPVLGQFQWLPRWSRAHPSVSERRWWRELATGRRQFL